MFTYDDSALQRVADAMGKLETQALGLIQREVAPDVDALVERAKANAPKKSGRLEASIHAESTVRGGNPTFELVADTPYALEVHERPPINDHDPDGTTPEGGRGRKYLTRVLDYHHVHLRETAARVIRALIRTLQA